jgi:hypothetical protein
MAISQATANDEIDDSKERVGKLSHAVKRAELKPGDHIYVYGVFGIYSHHGIYIGEEEMQVVHFSFPPNRSQSWNKQSAYVHSCTLDDFQGWRTLRLSAYNSTQKANRWKRKGSCHVRSPDPSHVVIARAKHYCENPQEYPEYDLRKNNCEHFATFCKTNIPSSKQADLDGANFISMPPPNVRINSSLSPGVDT